jgi:hypothetical protein
MPIALDPKSTFPYVLLEDRSLPEDQQTIFQLRGLTVAEEAQVSDSMLLAHSGTDEVAFRAGTQQLTVLRFGLRGWENFRTAEGEEVPFESTKGHPKHVTDACLDRLMPKHRQELMNAVMDRGEIKADEGE